MNKLRNLLSCLLIFISSLGNAQVITDGSMGAVQSLSGQFQIPQSLGTTVGNNLFHSFQYFNLQAGESATFTGAKGIQNVISRVTGGEVSVIDGLLRSTINGSAFYFINPAGVTFGANAQVDVPAAFHVSTADGLRFGDGGQFRASLAAPSQLSIAEPISFGFLGTQTAAIDIKQSTLFFADRSTVSFSGGAISLDSGFLENAAGTIALYSVGNQASEIDLRQTDSAALAGALTLNNHSVIDVSGDGAGQIRLRAGNIDVSRSHLFADNYGALNSGADKGIDVIARAMRVTSSAITTDVWDSGQAANINLQIKAGALLIANGGIISSDSYSAGNAGTIQIDAAQIQIDGQNKITGIFNNANPQSRGGNAGSIVLNSPYLAVLNGGQISNDTSAKGHAGSIVINAQQVLIDGQQDQDFTGIVSNANPQSTGGNAGNISVTTDHLTVINGGEIGSNTWSSGDGGSISIVAKSVWIDEQGKGKFTGLSSSTLGNTSLGNAGNVSITSNAITVVNKGSVITNTWSLGHAGDVAMTARQTLIDGGVISSNTQGAGHAGTVTVSSDYLSLIHGGTISSSTFAEGRAGDVLINASDLQVAGQASGILATAAQTSAGQSGNIVVNATDVELKQDGLISITTEPTVPAAMLKALIPTTLTVNAQHLRLSGGSQISAAALGNIPASKVMINAQTLTATNATLTTEANNADGGAIRVVGKTSLLRDSRITTSVKGQGNGGDIRMDNALLVLNGGFIQANTAGVGSSGGDIALNVQSLLTSHNQLLKGGNQRLSFLPSFNVIQAASPSGVSGNINLTAPQFDISGSISGLDGSEIVLPEITRNTCTNKASSASWLAPGGKGGIPLNEMYSGFVPPAVNLNDSRQPIQPLSLLPVVMTHNVFTCRAVSP